MNWSMRLTLSTRSSCAQWVMARRRLSVTWSMSIDMLDGAYGQVDSAVVDLCSHPVSRYEISVVISYALH